MSSSSGQAMEGHNIATTDSIGTDNGLTDSTNDMSIQEQEALIPSLDAFQQQYPDLQSALPGLDVIETMLDTPQNLDWVRLKFKNLTLPFFLSSTHTSSFDVTNLLT